ncbi:unnamed protein product [Sphagnum jensenii]|uniref:ENTH domain-containing protein n=1 Tax=Sphagnum jensenii TaxID=128206 RepID=A0ABP0WIY2_9BRYO
MAPRKLRQALGVVKDQTSISIAKVGGTKAPDLDVALVKACSHDEFFDDRYVEEVLHMTSLSRGYVHACVVGLHKRLSKTHNWIVALKSLMLIHRLLREGDPSFEHELLHATHHGMRMLNLSHFRDDSDSHSWDYSSFVRTFSLFLDERLDCLFSGTTSSSDRHPGGQSAHRRSKYSRDGSPSRSHSRSTYADVPIKEMGVKMLLEKLPALQQLLERVLGCRPTGAAKTNSLVQIALYPVVKESFQLYADISEGTTILLEGFFEMEQRDTVKAFDIYNRSAKQSDELHNFYNLCKKYGIGRSSEYPTIQKISQEHLDTMEDFLRTRSHSQRSKSPEPQPLQLEYRPETPQLEPTPETPQPEPTSEPEVVVPEPEAVVPPPPEVPQVQPERVQSEGDLLNLEKATISQQDQEDRLALALFSGTSGSTSEQGTQLYGGALQSDAADSGKAGWELALVASVSDLSKPTSAPMAGGFDPLLLTSMYDQGAVWQKQSAAAIPAGSASSVCIPNRPASSFLALPAPPGGMPIGETGEDPFAASLAIPPPAYVQMADMTVKQQLLVQEQIMWQKYQADGMHGEQSLMKVYSNPYRGMVPQSPFGFPHYGLGMPYYGVGMPIGNYSTSY